VFVCGPRICVRLCLSVVLESVFVCVCLWSSNLCCLWSSVVSISVRLWSRVAWLEPLTVAHFIRGI